MAVRFLLLSFLLGAASAGSGSVIFSQFTVDEVSSPLQLRSGAGATATAAVSGVAAEPGPTGDLFAIHSDAAQAESFLRVNAGTGGAAEIANSAGINQQLGGGSVTLASGFAFDAVLGRLYFGDSGTITAGQPSLVYLNALNGTAAKLGTSANLVGITDHTVLPDGTIAATRPGVVGTYDKTTGAWTERLNSAALVAASPSLVQATPETIAASAAFGQTFIFSHQHPALYQTPNLLATPPAVTHKSQVAGVDLHDLAADQYGNLYGLDLATNNIVIVRGTDGQLFSFPLANINTALGRGQFAPVQWRGLAARISSNPYQADLFLSSGNSNYGIIRVRFGTAPSAVTDWSMY